MLNIMCWIFTSLTLLISLIYCLLRKRYNYWNQRKVPCIAPSLMFGNFKDYILLKKYPGVITKDVCEQFPNAPYVGVYYGTEPALVVMDPDLIKLILTKDFYYFNGREVADYTHREVITQNIFFTQGDRWKVLRQNLTPLFSSSKLKSMFYLVKKCASNLEICLDKAIVKSPVIDARAIMSRYTIDTVSLCSFGINADTMGEENDNNPFRIVSEKILENSKFNGIKNVCRTLWPAAFYALGFKMFNNQVVDFFHQLVTEVFKERNYEPSSRNDFVDLILSLHKNRYITGDSLSNGRSGVNKKVSLETDDVLLVGQCVAFFAGGFETTSSTLTFTLFELAKHEEIQKRAIADVDAYLLRHKDGIDFDLAGEVPYLDACVDEALRLYPLLGNLTREVMEDYTLPNGLRLEKGLRIHIPTYYLQRHPNYFEGPEEYRPERFLGDNVKNITPYTYLPFGEGPRICIGMRFGKVQVLAALVTILKKYRIKLAEGVPRTVQFEPKVIVVQPAEKIMLTLIPRNIEATTE